MYKSIINKNFCLSKDHKTVQDSKEKFNFTKHTNAKINLLTSMAKSPMTFRCEILIRRGIPTYCDYMVPGDSYLM